LQESVVPVDIAPISSYLDGMDPVIRESARRHGIEDEDGRLLEIGVAEAEGVIFVVHAMTARSRFLR